MRVVIGNLPVMSVGRVAATVGSLVRVGDLLVRMHDRVLHLPGLVSGVPAEVGELPTGYDPPRSAVDVIAEGLTPDDVRMIVEQPQTRQHAVAEAVGRVRAAERDLRRLGVRHGGER